MSKANIWFETGEFARYITGSSTGKLSAWDNPKKQALGKHLCVNFTENGSGTHAITGKCRLWNPPVLTHGNMPPVSLGTIMNTPTSLLIPPALALSIANSTTKETGYKSRMQDCEQTGPSQDLFGRTFFLCQTWGPDFNVKSLKVAKKSAQSGYTENGF